MMNLHRAAENSQQLARSSSSPSGQSRFPSHQFLCATQTELFWQGNVPTGHLSANSVEIRVTRVRGTIYRQISSAADTTATLKLANPFRLCFSRSLRGFRHMTIILSVASEQYDNNAKSFEVKSGRARQNRSLKLCSQSIEASQRDISHMAFVEPHVLPYCAVSIYVFFMDAPLVYSCCGILLLLFLFLLSLNTMYLWTRCVRLFYNGPFLWFAY